MFGILQRMILWELLKVFVISLIGITGILLMAGIVAEASQQGLGPAQILTAIPLLIPSTLPYTIPATTLFATCVVYGRLAADNEILAIRAAGINVGNVALPGLALGLVMSCVTMSLYFEIIPMSHRMLRDMVLEDAEEYLYTTLRKQRMLVNPKMPYAMYVNKVVGRKLLGVIFKRHEQPKKGDPPGKEFQTDLVAQAHEAELKVDMKNKLLLVHMRSCVTISNDGSFGNIEDKIWEVPLPINEEAERRARDLTWNEMLELRAGHQQAVRDMQAIKLQSPSNKAIVQDADNQIRYHAMQSLYIDVELMMRPALALGCFFFIVVGCPVGIWFGRSDYLSSFITCFMPIVFVYYPLMLCGTGMAKEGRINPVIMVWAADAVLGAIGIGLLQRLVRK